MLFMNLARQFHSIDPPRQFNIGERRAKTRSSSHNVERRVRIVRFDDFKSRIFKEFHCVLSHQRFILDDKDGGLNFAPEVIGHAVTTWKLAFGFLAGSNASPTRAPPFGASLHLPRNLAVIKQSE